MVNMRGGQMKNYKKTIFILTLFFGALLCFVQYGFRAKQVKFEFKANALQENILFFAIDRHF